MIAKGVTNPNGVRLARYLVTGKENEMAELWQLRGFAAADIVEAFRSVHVIAAATKCRNLFFHLSLRCRQGERLRRSQWQHAVNRVERMVGLDGQPRAIAFHKDLRTGEEHLHAAWSRISLDTLTAKPLPFWKTRLKDVSRELEKEFGLAPVPNHRESSIRFAPTRAEDEQARRLGLDVHEIREAIKCCFERADSGHGFRAALADQGLIIARGNRRDFLVVDSAGGLYALGKRVLGVSAVAIRQRLVDLSADLLPTLDEARDLQLRQKGKTSAVAKIQSDSPEVCHGEPLPIGLIKPAPSPYPSASKPKVAGTTDEQGKDVRPGLASTATATEQGCENGQDPVHKTSTARKFGQVLKQQFRATVRALTSRLPIPIPAICRRRTGESAGAFQLVARRLLRPVVRSIWISDARVFLHESLGWLHLWNWNAHTDEHLMHEPLDSRDENSPSPHP